MTVRGFHEQDGARKVISHFVKAIRGDVARALLEAPVPPDAGGRRADRGRGRPRRRLDGATLDVITRG